MKWKSINLQNFLLTNTTHRLTKKERIAFHWRPSSFKECLLSMIIFYSFINGFLQFIVVLHGQLYLIKGCLPLKIIFHQRSSFIKYCLILKVHQSSCFIKGHLPTKVDFQQDGWKCPSPPYLKGLKFKNQNCVRGAVQKTPQYIYRHYPYWGCPPSLPPYFWQLYFWQSVDHVDLPPSLRIFDKNHEILGCETYIHYYPYYFLRVRVETKRQRVPWLDQIE